MTRIEILGSAHIFLMRRTVMLDPTPVNESFRKGLVQMREMTAEITVSIGDLPHVWTSTVTGTNNPGCCRLLHLLQESFHCRTRGKFARTAIPLANSCEPKLTETASMFGLSEFSKLLHLKHYKFRCDYLSQLSTDLHPV